MTPEEAVDALSNNQPVAHMDTGEVGVISEIYGSGNTVHVLFLGERVPRPVRPYSLAPVDVRSLVVPLLRAGKVHGGKDA